MDKSSVHTSDSGFYAANMLPSALLLAVKETIAKRTGKPVVFSEMDSDDEQPGDPAHIALAVAYANLLIDDPETVTPHHLKMLRSHFSIEQIHELTRFIKEKTSV
ncbi:hypothetical protein [Cesiribacter sp. SM1]|uniref:hypothetical protein n=1 Tax=Cesiribacter sp. SM1 TaxID=2861196 RepID=UPI001CD43DF3|nr:hypothetical protein [Cesiribacter sp. SM1]